MAQICKWKKMQIKDLYKLFWIHQSSLMTHRGSIVVQYNSSTYIIFTEMLFSIHTNVQIFFYMFVVLTVLTILSFYEELNIQYWQMFPNAFFSLIRENIAKCSKSQCVMIRAIFGVIFLPPIFIEGKKKQASQRKK